MPRSTALPRVEELASLDLSSDPVSTATLAQAAVALHHGYGAVEAARARIARCLEGSLPTGGGWHQALLASMALDIPEVRPAVLRRETADELRILPELRRTASAVRVRIVEDFRRLDEIHGRLGDAD